MCILWLVCNICDAGFPFDVPVCKHLQELYGTTTISIEQYIQHIEDTNEAL